MKDYEIDIKPDWNSLAHYEPDFRGAAIISADGTEVPMTEKMIQAAFDVLVHQDNSGQGGISSKSQKITEKNSDGNPHKSQRLKETVFA